MPELKPSFSSSSTSSRPETTPGFWQREWPLWLRILVVVSLYGGYFLLGGGLTGERMPYDAGHYWELAVSFQRQHKAFSLLYFDTPTRGYLAALLHFPALIIRFFTSCTMPQAAKAMGVVWAAALFAWLIPALWRQLVPGRVAGIRWLLLVLLAFVFWRDHFSFTMIDMPALALLLLALWACGRRGLGWWLVAGLCLAAAFNSRPMYLAAVPPALALAGWWSWQHGRRVVGRWALLLVGLGLALAPQLAINRLHFQQNTPLVLARVSDTQQEPLYLKQLTWGTRLLRYDADLSKRLFFVDPAGLQVLREAGISQYTSYGQFFSIALRNPLDYGWRYLRHLFNGLDVQQPAPYLLRDYGPERHLLQMLNYMALGLALSVIVGSRTGRWLSWPRALVLLALLLPCAVAIPTAIESRFVLPLHLLLLAVAAFRFSLRPCQEWWRGRPLRKVVALVGAGLWLGSCFWLSAATFRNLQPDPGKGNSLVDD
ncbi:hypothetical protein [Hymenobacter psychrotolerans]|uniref:Dolichyl-phosphate-mannose-protein mannosyltransferase n=1 Tax=Hymenobacter psychrotolerans DSM 18569 TaxID=1121959 RepID=A0A1M7E0N7_9BACT|nr:hypothetical protein [Hymenobacter psychrotolerans]SHL85233.1 hypothetical protein SAMN02746009_03500 [Hymenobacter psychrotolerans DSM 18569]